MGVHHLPYRCSIPSRLQFFVLLLHLPTCSIQGLSYMRVVLPLYLYLSSFSFSCTFFAIIISSFSPFHIWKQTYVTAYSFTYTKNIIGAKTDSYSTPLFTFFHSKFSSFTIVLISLPFRWSSIQFFDVSFSPPVYSNFHSNLCRTLSNASFKFEYIQPSKEKSFMFGDAMMVQSMVSYHNLSCTYEKRVSTDTQDVSSQISFIQLQKQKYVRKIQRHIHTLEKLEKYVKLSLLVVL